MAMLLPLKVSRNEPCSHFGNGGPTIPVRHSGGPLGLTLTLTLTPGMADPQNGGPVRGPTGAGSGSVTAPSIQTRLGPTVSIVFLGQ